MVEDGVDEEKKDLETHHGKAKAPVLTKPQQETISLTPLLFVALRNDVEPGDIPKLKESYKQIKWALLFIDLIFVGVVSNVNAIIEECTPDDKQNSPLVFFTAFCYFAVMFNTRCQMDFYSATCTVLNYFDELHPIPLFQNDIWHHLVVVVYGLGVFVSTANIDQVILEPNENGVEQIGNFGKCDFGHDYVVGFTSGFILSRMMILLWNAILVLASPDKKVYRRKYFVEFCTRAVLAIISIIVMTGGYIHPSSNVLMFCLPIVIAIDLFTDVVVRKIVKIFNKQMKERKPTNERKYSLDQEAFRKKFNNETYEPHKHPLELEQTYIKVKIPEKIAPDTIFCGAEEFIERINFIMMLVLGESILGFATKPYYEEPLNATLSQIFSFLLLASIGMLFYETVTVAEFEDDKHALIKGLRYRVPFYISNLVAAFLMLVAVSGMVQLYTAVGQINHTHSTTNTHVSESIDQTWASWLMAAGLCFMEVFLLMMRFLHNIGHYFMKIADMVLGKFFTVYVSDKKVKFYVITLLPGWSFNVYMFKETGDTAGESPERQLAFEKFSRWEMLIFYLLSIGLHISIFFIVEEINDRGYINIHVTAADIIIAHSTVTLATTFLVNMTNTVYDIRAAKAKEATRTEKEKDIQARIESGEFDPLPLDQDRLSLSSLQVHRLSDRESVSTYRGSQRLSRQLSPSTTELVGWKPGVRQSLQPVREESTDNNADEVAAAINPVHSLVQKESLALKETKEPVATTPMTDSSDNE